MQHHSLRGTADGWADLKYLWQWGFSNSHCQNYGKRILNGFPSARRRQAQRQDMHPVFLFMSPEGPAYLAISPLGKEK